MENFWHRHGKRAKKWLLLKEKSAKKQSPAAVKCPPEVRQKTFGVYYVKEETKEAKPTRLYTIGTDPTVYILNLVTKEALRRLTFVVCRFCLLLWDKITIFATQLTNHSFNQRDL